MNKFNDKRTAEFTDQSSGKQYFESSIMVHQFVFNVYLSVFVEGACHQKRFEIIHSSCHDPRIRNFFKNTVNEVI